MAQNNNFAIPDFLVTFFIGKRIFSKMLSDIIKNRENLFFCRTIGLPQNFIPPFFLEEKNNSLVYVVKQNGDEKYKFMLNGQPCREHIIVSGSYITFKNDDIDKVIKVLFVDALEIQVGYRKYSVSGNSEIFIGRNETNEISYNLNDFVSREKHVVIKIDADNNAYIEDLKRTIGVYVNGFLIQSQKLKPLDEIFMMGLSIVYFGSFIAVRNLRAKVSLESLNSFKVKMPIEKNSSEKYFVRTPRILKSLDNDEIEIDPPPAPPTLDKTPAILVLGPSATMFTVMLASLTFSVSSALSTGNTVALAVSGIMAGGMFMGALFWPSLLRKYQQKMTLLEDKHRKNRYTAYISDIEDKLIEKTKRAVRLFNEIFSPAPETLCSLLDNDKNRLRLWERSNEDKDFLSVRLGLGSKPFDVKIKIPKRGFQLYEDEMQELPDKIFKKYGTLSDVPLTINLADNNTIGVIGDYDKINIILREIILNIVALHSYDEVKLVIVTSSNRVSDYEILKNIPHIWSNDKKIRYFATNPEEVHFVFNAIDDIVKERKNLQRESAKNLISPHYVLIVTEPFLIEKEALLRYVYDTKNEVGITTIFAYGDITKLPKSCNAIIQSDNLRTGYYIKNENENKFKPFVLDNLNGNRFSEFISGLSRMVVKRDSRTLAIPDRISFLQVYKVGNVNALDVEQHWENNNSSKSLAAPIGVMAGNEVFNLDIHEAYHGSHGLVAGTTGSGKSEFLQSFILSLAINYSPREIAFVLVDFKGGDMARPFVAKSMSSALPHLAATISNLSGNILYRALVSLEAEIKSRQKLFNEAATILEVDKLDINSYHKYFKAGKLRTPLPHLVIIIDEFAQLKSQQSDFLTQLINVAQVGRSLGIHLILATQKPSGLVDPQIWSNSRFKICLKVADKQDSIDVINKPDSALIKNPGRLYVQVGYDEIYECVQSGYSGADYIPTKNYMSDDSITVHMTDNTANPIHSAKLNLSGNKTDKTQLEAIVARIVSIGQKKNLFVKPLWLDVLSEKIILSDIEVATQNKGLCTTTLGLVDFVRRQEQKPLTIEFSKTGNIGIYGASGTGKTTFLQTLIYSLVVDYKYKPTELNIYAMDFGGRNLGYLELLPHTGGVVFADDEDNIKKLFVVLSRIIEERKRLFAENSCGTFTEFRSISSVPIPAILVLIDNFAPFHERYIELSEKFFDIVSSGNTFGIYFIVTGNTRNSIYYKVTEHISTYFTFKMNDPMNYFDIHNIRPPVVPEDINGRGITVIDKEIVEFQTALARDGNNEAERLSAICEEFSAIMENWGGDLPVKISAECFEDDDNEVNLSSISTATENLPDSTNNDREHLVICSSKSGASVNYGLTLSENQKLGLLASDDVSMSSCYGNLLKRISEFDNRRIIFIDDNAETFKNIAGTMINCSYVSNITDLDALIDKLKPELNARLDSIENCYEQLFIVVAEYSKFFDMITDEQAAFMRKLVTYIDSPSYGIYFVCGYNVNCEKNNDKLFMSLLVNAENYLICPGSYDVATTKIESLPLISGALPNEMYFCASGKNVAVRW